MRQIKILLAVFLVFSLFGFCGVNLSRAAERIAYINLGEVFDDYEKAKDFDDTLEKEKEDKQNEREKKVKVIRKLKDELELLNKDKKGKKQTEIDEKIKELQEFDKEVNTELREKYDSMVREILKEINDTIREYGRQEKFDAIFDERALLYSDDSMNITSDVLGVLNARYKGKAE